MPDNSVDLAYEEFGSEVSPPLLILHGFFASSRNWRHIAEMLGKGGSHVYVLDLRHHGLSPKKGRLDYPAMTKDVVNFMDSKGVVSGHVLGHSMGGKIAMWLALNHPERVNKLIVADIAPKTYRHRFDRIIDALKALPLESINNRKEAESMLAEAIPQLSFRQFLLQNLVLKGDKYEWRIDLDVFLENAEKIAGFPDTVNLKPYRKAALFVAGAESDYVSKADIMQLFPIAEYTSIAGAGHWLHTQKPAAFIEVVENYLQRER